MNSLRPNVIHCQPTTRPYKINRHRLSHRAQAYKPNCVHMFTSPLMHFFVSHCYRDSHTLGKGINNEMFIAMRQELLMRQLCTVRYVEALHSKIHN